MSPEILDALSNIGVFHIPLEVTLASKSEVVSTHNKNGIIE